MSKSLALINFEKVVTKESQALLSLSQGIVFKYLAAFQKGSNENIQIGEDFLFNAVTQLLTYANNDNSVEKQNKIEEATKAFAAQEQNAESDSLEKVIKKLKLRKTPQELFDALNRDPKFVAKSLTISVKNQCIDRIIRWSSDKDASKKAFDESREYERNLKPAVRARTYEPQPNGDSDKNEGSWLEQILTHEDDVETIFADRLEGHMLEKGITLEEIELIKLKLSGYSYSEIAEKVGNEETGDKYRKIITRALAKIDLKLKDIP
ncbi:MAG: DNA-directed RNA polymerase specialized sigma24 family protein [Flavobacteriales bacterium]|jgi:DNA-directed RNA polymerase specialized sigma24 family protein